MSVEKGLPLPDNSEFGFHHHIEEEQVFKQFPPEMFMIPAYNALGVDFHATPILDRQLVRYTTQLAVATLRPQSIRKIEDERKETRFRKSDEERQRKLREKYGTSLNETVTIDGIVWPVQLHDSFIESMRELSEIPVIDDTNYEGPLPREYRRPDGTHILNDPGLAEALEKLEKNPRPYNAHKGYQMSIELDELALAMANLHSVIDFWDYTGNLEEYRDRYELFFDPTFYLMHAFQDFRLEFDMDPKDINPITLEVASAAVQIVIRTFRRDVQERHALKVKTATERKAEEEDDDDSYSLTTRLMSQQEVNRVIDGHDADINFDSIEPEDCA